jgi:predicted lipid-binding transport protein (Tim44 family)
MHCEEEFVDTNIPGEEARMLTAARRTGTVGVVLGLLALTTSSEGWSWRSVAGGVLGGILGGMLFQSLGFAGGFGDFGSGVGLLDLLFLAGIAYVIFWVVRRGQPTEEATATSHSGRMPSESLSSVGGSAPMAAMQEPGSSGALDLERGLGHIRQMDPGFDRTAFREWCSDAFFRIQAAWMRRDLEKLRPLLSEEMHEAFREQIEELRAKGRVNKMENIAVRSTELTEAWQDQGLDYLTVRYLASLLDYTVEETSGKLVEGSDREPVKFEEFWTWSRPVGPNPWRLTAIHQGE